MGLDVSAYAKLLLIHPCAWNSTTGKFDHDREDLIDEPDVVYIYRACDEFTDRLDGMTEGYYRIDRTAPRVCYPDHKDEPSWSYAGYNRWREFLISLGGLGDEAEWECTIYARDAMKAAEVAAAHYDSLGYPTIVSGSPTEFFVTDIHRVTKKFEVSGESVPTYSAFELPYTPVEVVALEEGHDETQPPHTH
jgi:hypothetical protein